MKAKIRGTNIVVDVQPFYDESGYFSGFKDGYEYYRPVDLVFPDTPDWDKTDWSTFRREAAKDILCALITHCSLPREDGAIIAIEYADALIAKLKEK